LNDRNRKKRTYHVDFSNKYIFGLRTHRRNQYNRKILRNSDVTRSVLLCKLAVINKSRFAWSDYLLNSCLLPHGELNANMFVLSLVIFLVLLGLKGPRFTGLLISSALRTTIASSNLPNDVMSRVFSSSSSLLSLISMIGAEECPLTRPSTITLRVCMTTNVG